MKRIFLITPEWSKEKEFDHIRNVCRRILLRGDMPVCTDLYMPLFLDPANPAERKMSVDAEAEVMRSCDEVRVMGSRLSVIMACQIALAGLMRKKVTFEDRSLQDDFESLNCDMEDSL